MPLDRFILRFLLEGVKLQSAYAAAVQLAGEKKMNGGVFLD